MPPSNLTFEDVFDPGLYLEINALMEVLPWRQRRICSLRFGFDGESPHTLEEVANEFAVTRERIRQIIDSSIRRLRSAAASNSSLLALDRVLGQDPAQWPARAWLQTAHRERHIHRQAEAQLLLAVKGLSWRDARRTIGSYLREQTGRVEAAREGHRSEEGRAKAAVRATALVDRFVAHVLWPSTTKPLPDLSAFSRQRHLPAQTLGKAGYFDSGKLKRPVQYESLLELSIFEAFEMASTVISYQEQPLQVDVTIDGLSFRYTPDVVIHLDDGRAVVIELKPPHMLGLFDGWLRWASLARWCGEAGLGLLVGSPRFTVIDLLHTPCNPRLRAEVLRAIDAAPVSWRDYRQLAVACNAQMTGLASVAVRETLDWRLVPFRLCVPAPDQRREASAWWRLVARCSYQA